MIYGITILISVLYVWVLSKNLSVKAIISLFIFLLLYGRFIFQSFDDFYNTYNWPAPGPDGTLTYSFVEVVIEPSWTNPEYLNSMIMHTNSSMWWLIWPAYFGVLWYIARRLKKA